MTLELRDDQARELYELLEWHTRELLQQIDKAFDRAFKSELRARYDRVEEIRSKLEQWLRPSEAPI